MYLVIPKFKLRQQYTDDLNRVTRENLTGIDVIRAYNAEDYQNEKFNQKNNLLTNVNLFCKSHHGCDASIYYHYHEWINSFYLLDWGYFNSKC